MLDQAVVNCILARQARRHAMGGRGLRDFFLYRDLGVAAATGGRVLAQLVKANSPPEEGTGWHKHVADFHIVIMLKGWARFMYEGEEHLVAAGDCVHQRPGITHYLFDYSPDMEYLEVVGPADFKTWTPRARCQCRRRRPGARSPEPAARAGQNSTSSSSICSGSSCAAATHSARSGHVQTCAQYAADTGSSSTP